MNNLIAFLKGSRGAREQAKKEETENNLKTQKALNELFNEGEIETHIVVGTYKETGKEGAPNGFLSVHGNSKKLLFALVTFFDQNPIFKEILVDFWKFQESSDRHKGKDPIIVDLGEFEGDIDELLGDEYPVCPDCGKRHINRETIEKMSPEQKMELANKLLKLRK